MKTKLLLSILFFGTLLQSNAQNVLPAMKTRPADYEYLSAPDSLGIRHPLKTPNISKKNLQSSQSLPYPIIFVHGLNSNELIWGNSDPNANLISNMLDSYTLNFGGRFDYNLNFDGQNGTANKLFWPNTNADLAVYTSSATAGDYYFVNFDVGSDGAVHPGHGLSSTDVLSNQSAIAKQGVALRDAIQRVLSLTNRDKVILMGHSMGGLASREYLQNPENWTDPFINHHVAKLVTTGTPHGGSNSTAPFLVSLYNGLNNRSEAMRDLKTFYSNSLADGVFLYGGYEYNTIIDDGSNYYYNVDVNCNGSAGDLITGLNNKSFNSDIDYAYIIGKCDTCTFSPGFVNGDGVVPLFSSNLSNFNLNLLNPKNEFIYESSSSIQIHTDLPSQNNYNIEALDEPNFSNLAYKIDFGSLYTGFITEQPIGGNIFDWDEYKFIAPNNINLILTIANTSSDNIYARINNSNIQTQGQIYTIPHGTSQFSIPLTAGQYFLEIDGLPSSTSYLHPYFYSLTYTLSNSDFISENSLNLFPNPTSSKVFFDNTNFNFKEVTIYNYLGQEVTKTNFTSSIQNQEIDMSNLATGVYVLKFSDGEKSKSVKVIKQ